MKTVTEFFGINLKNISKTVGELAASGKTPEEIQAAVMETFKVKEDRIKLLMDALEVVKSKQQGLKRVVVFSAAENETVPSGVQKKDDHYYLVEFFPAAPGAEKKRGRPEGRGDKRGDKRGGRKGKGRRDARAEGRGEGRPEGRPKRPARAPRPQPQFTGPKPPPVVVPRPKVENAPGVTPDKPKDGSASGPSQA